MNLDKVSEEEKLKISRKYFILGFFLLPVVWLANAVWFFREAFIKKHGHPKIRRYVAWSSDRCVGVGSCGCHMDFSVPDTTSQLGGSRRLYFIHCTSWKVIMCMQR